MRLQEWEANEIIFWIQHCGYFPRERNEAMLVLATAWQERRPIAATTGQIIVGQMRLRTYI